MINTTSDFLFMVSESLLDSFMPRLYDISETMTKYAQQTISENALLESVNTTRDISEDMYEDILEVSDNHLIKIDLCNTALKTNKWVDYAIWYMSHPNAKLIQVNKKTKRFVNAISTLAGYGLIYKDMPPIDLKIYDINSPERKLGGKFLINLDELKERLVDPIFVRNMNLKKNKIAIEELRKSEQFNDGDIIHPFFFNNIPIQDIGPKQGEGIDDILFYKLENSIGKLIINKYCYFKDQFGVLRAKVIKDQYGTTEDYVLDDGSISGGTKISILGMSASSGYWVWVNSEIYPDIAYNMLNRSFYYLNDDEVNRVNYYNLFSFETNRFIDMANTPWVDYLNDMDKMYIEKYVSAILRHHSNDPLISPYTKFRFKSYTNCHNFVLVSDENVILQSITNEPFVYTLSLRYTVENGDVIQTMERPRMR